jgi:hypothetical protein
MSDYDTAARREGVSLRLLLIDALDAPRRALAGQLVTHLGAGRITESRAVDEALSACPDPIGTPWDAVLISATDSITAAAAIARLRARLPDVPVVVMRPPPGATPEPDWPPGVVPLDRPARLATLVAALRGLLDRTRRPPHETGPGAFALGPFRCDPGGRTLTERTSGRTVPLTEKEAAILACLHGAAAPVSRDALLSQVWGYANGVASHTLETHIHRLRRKIESDPRQPKLLVKDGTGYRLGRES